MEGASLAGLVVHVLEISTEHWEGQISNGHVCLEVCVRT